MERKGPRKEQVSTKPEPVEYAQNQIDAERKHGLLLPNNIEVGSSETIPFFEFNQLLNQKDPKDIILYSAKTGLLRHLLSDTKKNGDVLYVYQGDYYMVCISYKKNSGQTHIIDVKTVPPYKERDELETGPYRKMEYIEDANEKENTVKKTPENITETDDIGIPLPEDLKEGDMLPDFKLAIEMNMRAEDIVLRSHKTGDLKHKGTQKIGNDGVVYYHYASKKTPSTNIIISLNKNLKQACVISLSVNNKIEERKI